MALQELIQSWWTRRWCNRCQLESLVGHLHHAAKVVWPGRTVLQHMLDLLCCSRTRDHPIRLSSEFWRTSWDRMSLWLFPGMSTSTDVEVTSDAAGFLCFGAYYNNEWFSGAWVPSQADQSIAYKELFSVVVAVVHILLAIYSLLLLALTLLSLHIISPAFITILLMLFPPFIGRTSGVSHPRHNFTQFQLLLYSGSS